MLSIFLMILKVIGIILLVIVGLFLTILLILLLVPLRYKGQGSYYGKIEGTLKLSWFFHIISATVSYHEEPEIIIKLLGFRILKEEKQQAEDFGDLNGDLFEEPMVSAQELKKPMIDPKEEPLKEESAKTEPAKTGGLMQPSSGGVKREEARTDLPNQGFLVRLLGRIKKMFRQILNFIKSFIEALKKTDHLKEKVLDTIRDEENKKTFYLLIRQSKKILRHILPVKLKGHISFGFDDPYTTGQILTGAAFFYPVYRDNFTILPVFDQEIIEGDLSFKGRIRLCVFLTAGLKILLNKNFRVQLKKIMNRGGM